MAIVVYKCDVCKREKEYVRNVEGIEKIQRCTITHGCRGKLFQTKLLQDYVRASTSGAVLGLDDWRQRKVLYNHEQTIARDNWIIQHNLGTFPSISVFVNIPIETDPENLEEIQPVDVVIVNENNMILKFDRSWSGIAQLVARQSDPNLLKPFTRLVENVQELQQISFSGEIAVATLISSTGVGEGVSLFVKYTTTQNVTIDHEYVATANINITESNSSWRDFERVVIKGKLYMVRSFDGYYDDMSKAIIGSGSTFKIENISHGGSPAIIREVEQDEVYILFANAPYETVDKETLKYIDVFDINQGDNTFAFLYDNNEFFSQKSVIQTTYPPIRVVS